MRVVLIAHPSPDLYGADLQMLQTVAALVEGGWGVVVALPGDGPLVTRLEAAGARIVYSAFPVLRKADARLGGLVRLLAEAAASLPRSVRLLREQGAEVLLVNTVTLPWWVLAGRLARIPTLVHLHEAETEGRRVVRRALMAPLHLATRVILISAAARRAMVDVAPGLEKRARLVFNGVVGPEGPVSSPPSPGRIRLAVVGRLSPRKAPHLAIEALAQLVEAGYDVELEVAGSVFPGYEWYEHQLRERAAAPGLAGRVHFSGYCSPIWPVLARSTVVLAPSMHEPFGNVVVEAQLAGRPVVAAAAQGHLETIAHGVTGLLVAPGDAKAMSAAVRRLLDDQGERELLAERARVEASRRFSVDRYGDEMRELVADVARPGGLGR